MKSNSTDFKTYEQLYSLLNRYIRYCYTWKKNKHKYYDWNVDKLTERFMKSFKTKYAIEQWFLGCFNGYKTILEPTSYYDLELKLSIRGY